MLIVLLLVGALAVVAIQTAAAQPPRQERESAHERFQRLPPDRQKRIEENLRRYESMTPAERERVEHNFERWQKMSPAERQQFRERWQQMAPDERKRLRE